MYCYSYVTLSSVTGCGSNGYVVNLGLEERGKGRQYTVVLEVTRVSCVVRIGRIGDVAPVVELQTVVISVRSEMQRRTVSNREVNTRVDRRINDSLVRSESSGEGLRFLDVRDRTRCFGATIVPLYEVETGFRSSGDDYTSVAINFFILIGVLIIVNIFVNLQ